SRDGTPGLTVVCAALNIASEAVLRPSVRTVVLGGVAEPYSFELTGPLAAATMRDLWLDTRFVGTVGLDLPAGLACNSEAEAGAPSTATSRDRGLDTMCVGTVGRGLPAGLTCNSDADPGFTRIMSGHSRRVAGLATSDKIGHRALAGICPVSLLTDLVIAGPVPDALRTHLEETSVRLHEV